MARQSKLYNQLYHPSQPIQNKYNINNHQYPKQITTTSFLVLHFPSLTFYFVTHISSLSLYLIHSIITYLLSFLFIAFMVPSFSVFIDIKENPLIILLQMDDCNRVAASDLIIIITTSPIQSNPSTAIIDMAIQSIFKQPTLDDVAIHIICDGAKMALDSVNKYKSGIITEQRLLAYQQFKLNLGLKYKGNKRIVIQQRQSRFCFAKNIKYVMQKVEHQFVLIFQHDHVLMRTVDIAHIVEKMRKHPINYVGFMSKSVQKLAYQLDENMNLRQYFSAKVGYVPQLVRHSHQEFEGKVVSYYQELYELPLMPLIFWYDKVHIAKRKYYLDVIFDKGFYDENKQVYQKTISFVEDSFGCFMRKAIRRKPQRFEELSAFIYWDSMQCLVFHSHGRNYLSKESKQILQEQHRKGRQESSSAKASSKSQQFEYYNLQMLDG